MTDITKRFFDAAKSIVADVRIMRQKIEADPGLVNAEHYLVTAIGYVAEDRGVNAASVQMVWDLIGGIDMSFLESLKAAVITAKKEAATQGSVSEEAHDEVDLCFDAYRKDLEIKLEYARNLVKSVRLLP